MKLKDTIMFVSFVCQHWTCSSFLDSWLEQVSSPLNQSDTGHNLMLFSQTSQIDQIHGSRIGSGSHGSNKVQTLKDYSQRIQEHNWSQPHETGLTVWWGSFHSSGLKETSRARRTCWSSVHNSFTTRASSVAGRAVVWSITRISCTMKSSWGTISFHVPSITCENLYSPEQMWWNELNEPPAEDFLSASGLDVPISYQQDASLPRLGSFFQHRQKVCLFFFFLRCCPEQFLVRHNISPIYQQNWTHHTSQHIRQKTMSWIPLSGLAILSRLRQSTVIYHFHFEGWRNKEPLAEDPVAFTLAVWRNTQETRQFRDFVLTDFWRADLDSFWSHPFWRTCVNLGVCAVVNVRVSCRNHQRFRCNLACTISSLM